MKLPFVNADEIAIELSPMDLRRARVKAGRLFFKKIEDLLIDRKSFILETTLAGRYLVHFVNRLKVSHYRVELIYIFVETEEEAIKRIDIRVKKGGHPVPEEDIRRRFNRSKLNFWNIYRHLVDSWQIFLNSKDVFLQVAVGSGEDINIINETGFLHSRGGSYGERGL